MRQRTKVGAGGWPGIKRSGCVRFMLGLVVMAEISPPASRLWEQAVLTLDSELRNLPCLAEAFADLRFVTSFIHQSAHSHPEPSQDTSTSTQRPKRPQIFRYVPGCGERASKPVRPLGLFFPPVLFYFSREHPASLASPCHFSIHQPDLPALLDLLGQSWSRQTGGQGRGCRSRCLPCRLDAMWEGATAGVGHASKEARCCLPPSPSKTPAAQRHWIPSRDL